MATPSAKRALIVFAKSPIPGAVKTRLIPALGEQGAVSAHEELVQRTLQAVAMMPSIDVSLWESKRDGGGRVWADAFAVPLHVQHGADIGERMREAIGRTLASGADHVVLVGCDCPTITRGYVHEAFAALEVSDVVLGPVADGGYVLVGTKADHPELFCTIPWGSDRVLDLTRRALRAAGLSWRELKEAWDVDTPGDWRRYRELVERERR